MQNPIQGLTSPLSPKTKPDDAEDTTNKPHSPRALQTAPAQ